MGGYRVPEKCTIRNIKCFEEITLDFRNPDGGIRLWNVLIGENGTGKTTLLQAIAIALLGEKAASVLLPRPRGWVRTGAVKGEIAAMILPEENLQSFDIEDEQSLSHPLSVKYEIEESKEIGTNISELKDGAFSRRSATQRDCNLQSSISYGWLAAGYGPFRRLQGGSEHTQEIAGSKNRESRFVTLFFEDAALTDCVEWLMRLDHARRDDTDPYYQQQSTNILETVRGILNDDLLPQGVYLDAINSQGVFFKLHIRKRCLFLI